MNVGVTTVLGSSAVGTSLGIYSTKIVLAQVAIIQSLSVYITSVIGHVTLSIYDDDGSGSRARTLKAYTASVVAVNGWNTLSVLTPVQLPAGTYYLAFQLESATCYYDFNGQGVCSDSNQVYGTPPTTFPASSWFVGMQFSIYATFQLLMPAPNLTKAHVHSLSPHDLLNSNNVTLPAPPAGLTWIRMVYTWPKHDIDRVNGLT